MGIAMHAATAVTYADDWLVTAHAGAESGVSRGP